ncbi:MAG: M24 family metallopeptidase [Paracoccaceae bacterium]
MIFPTSEFQRRTRALQTRMEDDGIDALLLTSPADIFYTTGFLTRFWESPARPWFVVVPSKGDPIAVIPSIGQALMAQCWICDIRTWDAPDPDDDGLSLLCDTLSEQTGATGRVGVAMGLETSLRMPLGDYHRLLKTLKPRQIVDATSCLQRVREIKSELEIDKIRTACEIAGRAFDRVPEIVKTTPGLDQIFRHFQMALLEEGADWVSYVAGGAGQNGYGDVISPAAARPVQTGDVLMLDTGAVTDGYFCDFDRNYSIGPPSQETRRIHAALTCAIDTALANIRTGMLARDVHAMLSQTLQDQAVTPGGGRLGHGLGVTLTEWPSFTPKDTTVLRSGMVLTLEPGALVDATHMIIHEENIVLRDTGAELLSPRAPAEMPVIEI